MDLTNEPEIDALLSDGPSPDWVRDVLETAISLEPRAASRWLDEIAGVVGRRANRLIREQLDATGF